MTQHSGRATWLLIFLACLLVATRLPYLHAPLSGKHHHRQNESASIARNFADNGMNLFKPQIQWGGAGPGYVEEAFQFYTYAVAVLAKVFGWSEMIGRATSLAFFALAALLLAQMLTRSHGLLAGILVIFFMTFSPMGNYYSRSFQPDAWGLFFTVAAVYFFEGWSRTQSRNAFILSLLATTAAGLTKPPNLFFGLALLYLAVRNNRWRSLRQPQLWLFSGFVFVTTASWYWYAHRFWIEYGNSAGLWGVGFSKTGLATWPFLRRMARRIVFLIATVPGSILMSAGAIVLCLQRSWLWVTWALGLFIVMSLTTGGQSPHDYYQLPWVVVFAVFAAAGCSTIVRQARNLKRVALRQLTYCGLILLIVATAFSAQQSLEQYYSLPRIEATLLPFAHRLKALSQPQDLVIIGSHVYYLRPGETFTHREPEGFRLPGDPIALYQAQRRGWVVPMDMMDEAMLDNLEAKGARFWATWYGPVLKRDPDLVALLARRATLLETGDRWSIYALKNP